MKLRTAIVQADTALLTALCEARGYVAAKKSAKAARVRKMLELAQDLTAALLDELKSE